MTTNIPNLDHSDDLMTFWAHYQRGRNYRELFPDGGKGTKRATANLACYASNKHAAIHCREHGDVKNALMYESICDRIYNELPESARW